MIAMRCGAVASALLVAAANSLAQSPATTRAPWSANESEGWGISWPTTQTKIVFQGVLSLDGAGMEPGVMLYPAPNVVGFVVAILTHAALIEGAKNSQKAALQAQADQVLSDYSATIDGFAPEDLVRRTAAGLRATTPALRESGDARWSLEVSPLFRMTQDRRALIVDNAVTVRMRGAVDVVRSSVVRVVATPRAADGAAAWWGDNGGEALRAESARLLALAISLSLADMAGHWDQAMPPHRTIRFAEGGDERIERAQILDQQCGRAVVRTLRGDLMAIPLRSMDSSVQVGCPEADEALPPGTAASAPLAR